MTRIEQGRHLLKMIEAVDVNDTDTLDEIDARFSHWRYGQGIYKGCNSEFYSWVKEGNGKRVRQSETYTNYTRSLDALHDVMPDGWRASINYRGGTRVNEIEWYVHVKHLNSLETQVGGETLPTMRLAWLHAIIQAYIYMEGNGEKLP